MLPMMAHRRVLIGNIPQAGGIMDMTRREFVKDSLTALGFLALPGTPLFAAPGGWKPKKKPNLVLGILSDTHLMVEWDGVSLYRSMTLDYIRNAFRLFKARGIDAFLHLGDASHRGGVREWEFHTEVFDSVFGRRNAPPKIFVVGNHELYGDDGHHIRGVYPDPKVWKERAICADIARHYQAVWGEPYSEFFHREVKGYHFFCRHWVDDHVEQKALHEDAFADYILSKAGDCSLRGTKPFFILSHRRHHGNFCKALREFPNAIGFVGHWHHSNADWKSIYYEWGTSGGYFPNVALGSCRYDGGCGIAPPGDIILPEDPVSFRSTDLPSRQAMIVNVYDDMVVFERHEVAQGGKLGADWVLPLGGLKPRPAPHPFSRAELKKVIGTPQFGKKAKLSVVRTSTVLPDPSDPEKRPPKPDSNAPKTACVRVKIPMADGNPNCRVFAYNVVVVGDDPKARYFKSEYFSGVNLGIGHEPNGGVTTVDIPVAELPAGKTLTVAVRPVSSLGTKGKAIATKFKA